MLIIEKNLDGTPPKPSAAPMSISFLHTFSLFDFVFYNTVGFLKTILLFDVMLLNRFSPKLRACIYPQAA